MNYLKNGLERSDQGFTFGGLPLPRLIEKYGTPLYLYDGKIIRKRLDEIRESIPYEKLELFYAMKANNNPHLLNLLGQEGVNIDAVSEAEVLLALKCGFSADRIIYTANHITDDEMTRVGALGITANIGSLSRLEKWGQAFPSSSICIRFNPNVVAGEFKQIQTGGDLTKFGILLEEVSQVCELVAQYDLKVVGLHKHAGSGISETSLFLKSMKNLLSVALTEYFPDLRFVDFGGGFKVPYGEDEKPIDYSLFGEEVATLFTQFCTKYGRELKLFFEPGKFLISESAIYVIQVNTLKNNKGRRIAGTNGGFPQFIRPTYYGAYHSLVNLSHPQGKSTVYDVVGNICESGDIFALDRAVPEIREGDYLAFLNAGAYCYSMGGNYNLRPLPTEVLVDGEDRVIRIGLTPKELSEKIWEECLC